MIQQIMDFTLIGMLFISSKTNYSKMKKAGRKSSLLTFKNMDDAGVFFSLFQTMEEIH